LELFLIMLKIFKWMLGAVVTLAVLLVLAALILPQIIDPNDYRQQITELVKEQTGRDLTLDGDLSVSVFPWLGIRTQGLQFSQPAQIGGTMVSVDKAQLRVKVVPLFSKRVEIDTVVLQAPEVNIVTLKNGLDSFAGLAGEDETPEVNESENSSASALALVIQGLALTDGKLTWDDRQAGSRYDISNFNLVSGNLIGDQLADLSASGLLRDVANPDTLEFKLKGQARIDTESLELTMQTLQADMVQGAQSASLEFDQLRVDQNKNVNLSALSGILRSDALNDQRVTFSVPSITANLDSQRASINVASLVAGDMTAKLLDLNITQFSDAPSAKGRIDVPAFNALKLANEFGFEFEPADSSALKAVALTADFSGNLDHASINNLVFNLDNSQLSGKGSVRDFESPKITFDLALDQLNLDNYLPESDESDSASDDSVSGAEALAVPMAVFKDVFANGRFKAQQLVSGGLELNDVDVDVKSSPGSVTITPRANLYDGKVGGAIAFSDKGGQQQLRVQNEIDLVDLSKMLNAAEITDQLSGIGSLVVDLLVTEKNGVQSNTGTIKLLAKNGALKGVDLKGIVDKGYAQYQSFKGREPSQDDQQTGDGQSNDETRFAELIGTFNIQDFKITNNDFALKAPLFRVGGEGEINIDSQTVNYLVSLSIVNSTDGQGGEALEKLKGLTLPIRFTGDLSAPRYSFDTKALYKSLVKRELDEKKGEYLQEKFGIEGGEELSTKDTVKQLLLNKLLKKDKQKDEQQPGAKQSEQAAERPLFEADRSQDQSAEQGNQPNQSDRVPDVSANPDSTSAEQQQPVDNRSEKDKLKDELKESLLNSIFN